MKISTQTRYAMRLLLELSMLNNEQDRMTTQEIADSQGISEKYLESIAAKLKRAGFIASIKGVGGGYKLALPPEKISLGKVMRLMETSYFQHHCLKDPSCCKFYNSCVMMGLWYTLEKSISEVVDNVTLSYIKEQFLINQNEMLKPEFMEEILSG